MVHTAAYAAPVLTPVAPPGGQSHGTVGWSTLRRLDLLPYLADDAQTRQYSSFDRSGGDFDAHTGNRNGTGGCLRSGGVGCVIAEDAGAGEIDSIWFTRDNGNVTRMGRIRIALDGRPVLDAPLQSVVNGALGAPFVYPLVANGDQSPGGVYIKVPMPYRHSMRVSIQSGLQYYHVTYRHFADALGIGTFNPHEPADDVVSLLSSPNTDPKTAHPHLVYRHTISLPAHSTRTIAAATGAGTISTLRLHIPSSTAAWSGLRLRIAFDGHNTVDSPIGEFFGAGLGPSSVRALMFSADPSGTLTAWWPMPFAHSTVVTLVNTMPTPVRGVSGEVDVTPDNRWATALTDGTAGYFTAISHAGLTVPGQDWIFAEQTGRGKFVGVSETMRGTASRASFSAKAPLFLEGADRVYTDGSRSPQIYGTGTEDFYEGGWYFRNGTIYSDPLTGQPAHETATPGCRGYCVAAYRLLPDDAVSYRSRLHFGMEHGKRNMIPAFYSSTAFLYTQADPTLLPGDSVSTADPIGRFVHGYRDSNTSDELLASTYEGTADLIPVIAPARATGGPVEFRMFVRPDNHGVLLRRMSDQNEGYQSASVLVDGRPVGRWLQPRANHIHRWLDDSFTLPESATAGKPVLTVTLIPTVGSPSWSSARYQADPLLD